MSKEKAPAVLEGTPLSEEETQVRYRVRSNGSGCKLRSSQSAPPRVATGRRQGRRRSVALLTCVPLLLLLLLFSACRYAVLSLQRLAAIREAHKVRQRRSNAHEEQNNALLLKPGQREQWRKRHVAALWT
jgi:hypothetical protein